MSGQPRQCSTEDLQNMMSAEAFGLYDGASGESTPASSPELANTFVEGYVVPQYPWFFNKANEFLPHGPGSIPIQVEFEAPYNNQDRRKRKSLDDKPVSSHVHSADFLKRRRAQNRASQRAFRDRKEKHMKELGQRLEELEVKHQDLKQSYEDLQAKYESAREKLGMLSTGNESSRDSPLGDLDQTCLPDTKNEDLSALFFYDSNDFLFQGDFFGGDNCVSPSNT